MSNPEHVSAGPHLSDFEASVVALGISAAAAFSLPKSVGAIYGLAYASADALSMDDFVERLGIATGSASQGLRFLQRMGAVKPVYRAAERRTLYVPEESVRRLILGILNENFLPQLRVTASQLPELRGQLNAMKDRASPEQAKRAEWAVLEKRLATLEGWSSKSGKVLPWLSKVLSGPLGS